VKVRCGDLRTGVLIRHSPRQQVLIAVPDAARDEHRASAARYAHAGFSLSGTMTR
jgi:hypothetical protein